MLHDIALNGDQSEIEIRTSPVASIMVIGPEARSLVGNGAGLTCHRFPLEKFQGSYCRVTIIDSGGKRAWSNPIWLD